MSNILPEPTTVGTKTTTGDNEQQAKISIKIRDINAIGTTIIKLAQTKSGVVIFRSFSLSSTRRPTITYPYLPPLSVRKPPQIEKRPWYEGSRGASLIGCTVASDVDEKGCCRIPMIDLSGVYNSLFVLGRLRWGDEIHTTLQSLERSFRGIKSPIIEDETCGKTMPREGTTW